jgi:hypothetical protein
MGCEAATASEHYLDSTTDSFAQRLMMPPIILGAGRILKEGKNLRQEGIIGRLYCPSTCASAASA